MSSNQVNDDGVAPGSPGLRQMSGAQRYVPPHLRVSTSNVTPQSLQERVESQKNPDAPAWKSEGRRARESYRDGRPQGRRQEMQTYQPPTPSTPERLEAIPHAPAWQDDDTPPVSAPATPAGHRKTYDGPYRPPMTVGPRRRGHDWSTPLERDMRLEKELFPEADMVNTDSIDFSKYENIPADLTGNNPTAPILDFRTMELPTILRENVKLAGYVVPTPVQKYAIPAVVAGRDIMACAQTGSGKTAAFLFPVIAGILEAGPSNAPLGDSFRPCAYPSVLILAPTRELSQQIFNEARKFTYRSMIKPVVVYGGADIRDQIRELRNGCDILVATPGRLVDIMDRGKVKLSYIKYLILDEADRMLDMGFEPQIRAIVEGRDMPDVYNRHTLMFSATFPVEIQKLSQDFLNDYLFLRIGRVGSTTDSITQRVFYVPENEKRSVLVDLLHADNSGMQLVFVETKREADALEDYLYREGFPSTAIHGDRTQDQRENALRSFKSGRTPIMVATDVAARGLDIPNVAHVINYDLPNDIDSYVHRIGRTGRAGKTGVATSLFSDKNKALAEDLVVILKENKQEIPAFLESFSRESSRFGSSRRGGYRPHGGRQSGHVDYRRDGQHPRQQRDNHSGRFESPW